MIDDRFSPLIDVLAAFDQPRRGAPPPTWMLVAPRPVDLLAAPRRGAADGGHLPAPKPG